MSKFVLDTNIVSYYLKGNKIVIDNIADALANDAAIEIAPIAYYEIKRGLLSVGATKKLEKFEKLCILFHVGGMDTEMLDIATDIYMSLRKKGRLTEDADILIAAYCKQGAYTLVTHNTRHFDEMDIDMVDWATG
jgi:predicted nucleic acid-binding protein